MARRIFGFYALPLYILVRPIKGFYNMKFEGQGKLKLAFFNYIMVCISFAFMSQYSSVLVNPRNPMRLNSFVDFMTITIILILFCVSNWSVTSLTNGEGKFKEIFMTVCYAMTPLVLLLIPAAVLSNILTENETGFFFMLVSFASFWFVLLTFIGLIVIHNYTVSKALVTVALTFVSFLIILFLITLLMTLLQQVYIFVNGIRTEISFRL